MSVFCRRHEKQLQTYWDILCVLKTKYGKAPDRRTKWDWMKKMRHKISHEVDDRDTMLYRWMVRSTKSFRDFVPLVSESLKQDTYQQTIYLFNRGVQYQGWESLEERIALFNRVWLLPADAKPKDLTLYNKRAMMYMTHMKSNNYMCHLILYLHIQSQTEHR